MRLVLVPLCLIGSARFWDGTDAPIRLSFLIKAFDISNIAATCCQNITSAFFPTRTEPNTPILLGLVS